jgi:hypothetical protein
MKVLNARRHMKEDNQTEEERVLVLAEQVKNLLVFSALLIPDLDLLEKVARQSADTQSPYSGYGSHIRRSGAGLGRETV